MAVADRSFVDATLAGCTATASVAHFNAARCGTDIAASRFSYEPSIPHEAAGKSGACAAIRKSLSERSEPQLPARINGLEFCAGDSNNNTSTAKRAMEIYDEEKITDARDRGRGSHARLERSLRPSAPGRRLAYEPGVEECAGRKDR